MLKSQAQTLNDTGLALLDKATKLTITEEVNATIELGMRCLEEARVIFMEVRSNSVLTFIECGARVGALGTYGEYLDFCARNGLETMSEIDFQSCI